MDIGCEVKNNHATTFGPRKATKQGTLKRRHLNLPGKATRKDTTDERGVGMDRNRRDQVTEGKGERILGMTTKLGV